MKLISVKQIRALACVAMLSVLFVPPAGFVGSAAAAVLSVGTHLNPYELSGRATNWDQNIESESGQVNKFGSYANYNVDAGATPWGSGTWLYSGYVEVAFTVPADTLFVQFQADTNDGIAQFLVDGVDAGSVNTFNKIWFQVAISGLSLGLHTLRVNRVTRDLAFDNFGAVATTVVPLPAALPLFGTGLGVLGLMGWRKKKRRSAA